MLSPRRHGLLLLDDITSGFFVSHRQFHGFPPIGKKSAVVKEE